MATVHVCVCVYVRAPVISPFTSSKGSGFSWASQGSHSWKVLEMYNMFKSMRKVFDTEMIPGSCRAWLIIWIHPELLGDEQSRAVMVNL